VSTHLCKTSGYWRVNLRDPATARYSSYPMHRLLMLTFSPPADESFEVNHIDGDKSNNCLTNLEWCSKQDNLRHAWDNGLRRRPSHAILTRQQAEEIRALYFSPHGTRPTMGELGKRFGVTHHAVWRIIHNKVWKPL